MFNKPNLIKLYKNQLNKIRTLLLSSFAKQVELMLIKEIISKLLNGYFRKACKVYLRARRLNTDSSVVRQVQATPLSRKFYMTKLAD